MPKLLGLPVEKCASIAKPFELVKHLGRTSRCRNLEGYFIDSAEFFECDRLCALAIAIIHCPYPHCPYPELNKAVAKVALKVMVFQFWRGSGPAQELRPPLPRFGA